MTRDDHRERQSAGRAPNGLSWSTAPPSPRRRSRPAFTSSRRRSETWATSPCARSRFWRRPTRCSPRTQGCPARCSSRYGIETPLSPYHEHNAAEARPRALRRIADGQALALISDAGTPLVSDPGFKLVAEAVAAGLAVTTAPGASAVLAALCVAGLPTDRFFFEGFLPPRSAARRERINALAAIPGTLVFYEAPSRLADRSPISRGARPPAGGGRARTHQAPRGGPARDARRACRRVRRGKRRAEKSSSLSARRRRREAGGRETLDAEIRAALGALSVKDAAAAVAAKHGLPRREIYARALALAGRRPMSRRRPGDDPAAAAPISGASRPKRSRRSC